MPKTKTAPAKTYLEEMQEICLPYGVPGRDHASMLLYCQHVEGNHTGDVMWDAGQRIRLKRRVRTWKSKYSTRKWDGSLFDNHDDVDCVEDLEGFGLLKDVGTGAQPMVTLTTKGHELCGKLLALRGRHP